MPDPSTVALATADNERTFRGEVEFIADRFLSPGIDPQAAVAFFDRGYRNYVLERTEASSRLQDAVDSCRDETCNFLAPQPGGAQYEVILDHIDLVYRFTYKDIQVLYSWLATLPEYVRPTEMMQFGHFRLRAIFNGRDLENDEPVNHVTCYSGRVQYVAPPPAARNSSFVDTA